MEIKKREYQAFQLQQQLLQQSQQLLEQNKLTFQEVSAKQSKRLEKIQQLGNKLQQEQSYLTQVKKNDTELNDAFESLQALSKNLSQTLQEEINSKAKQINKDIENIVEKQNTKDQKANKEKDQFNLAQKSQQKPKQQQERVDKQGKKQNLDQLENINKENLFQEDQIENDLSFENQELENTQKSKDSLQNIQFEEKMQVLTESRNKSAESTKISDFLYQEALLRRKKNELIQQSVSFNSGKARKFITQQQIKNFNQILDISQAKARKEEAVTLESLVDIDGSQNIDSNLLSQVLKILSDKYSSIANNIQTLKQLLEKEQQATDNATFLCTTYRKLSQNLLAYTHFKQKQPQIINFQETFRPQICEKSQFLVDFLQKRNGRVYESLYNQRNSSEPKIQIHRELLAEKEIAPCTFHPKTNHNSQFLSSQLNGGQSCYERLYSKKNSPKMDIRQTQVMELEKCTFYPILKSNINMKQIAPAKGYEQNIARLRQAQLKKEEKQKKAEKIPAGENYENLRKQGVKPFNLQGKPQKKKVLLYIDVNIGPGKTGRIGIHEDDNLDKITFSFSKTYQLNNEQKQQLKEMLSSQLQNYLETLQTC